MASFADNPPLRGDFKLPKWPIPTLVSVGLALLIFAAFMPVLWHDFVTFDDPDYVTDNQHVQGGLTLDGVRWAFQTGFGGNWHPLTWLSHMVDCEIFGLAAGGHHLTNLLLHIGNSILLFFVLRRMTRSDWKSALVAAVFGLHPLHVESVAWVSERKDLLSTFFGLLAISAYARYAHADKGNVRGRWRFFALALLFFAFSLMSKPMLVTLPFVLLLLDFWPLQRTFFLKTERQPLSQSDAEITGLAPARRLPRLLWEKSPFLALTVALCAITFIFQKQTGAMKLMNSLSTGPRLVNALISYCRYLEITFWPSGLTAFYPYPKTWPPGYFVAALALLALVTLIVVYFIRRRPYLAVGWFWFLGMLVPVIGIIQVGLQAMADRYMYLPMVGVLIMVVWSAGEIVAARPALRPVCGAIAIVVVVTCGLLTARQVRSWKSSQTLFQRMIAVTSDNVLAEYSLGTLYANAGDYDRAFYHLERARNIKPDYGEVLNNLGLMLVRRGKVPEGVTRYHEAIQAGFDKPEVRFNLGLALAVEEDWDGAAAEFKRSVERKPEFYEARWRLARVLVRQGKISESKAQCEEVLRVEPNNVEAQITLGMTFAGEKDYSRALELFKEVVQRNAGNIDARLEAGHALLAAGQKEEALHEYEVAASLNTNTCVALLQRARYYVQEGKGNLAIDVLRAATQIAPKDIPSREKLGSLLAQSGHLDEAITNFLELVQLRPDAESHCNLAMALASKGEIASAIQHYNEAIRIDPESPVAYNNLAWLRATFPDGNVRNGVEAVRLAERACEITRFHEPMLLGTLAAAYAEVGRFDEATATCQKAVELATDAGLKDLVTRNLELKEKYLNHRPHREPASSP